MKRESLALILESSSYNDHNTITDMEIFESSIPTPTGHPIHKARFRVILQESDVRNQNGRIYDNKICNAIVEALKPKVESRSLFQEVDHPMILMKDDDGLLSKKRAIIVEMKNCGSILTEIFRDGRKIIGIVETLSSFLGPDLFKLVVEDKAGIGFSLRSFGRVITEESSGEVLHRVTEPIRPITYDVVTNPSHSNAKVVEVYTESLNSFMTSNNESESILNESTLFDVENLKLPNSNLDVLEFREQLFKESFRNRGLVKFNI
jgi:hypothetical protein